MITTVIKQLRVGYLHGCESSMHDIHHLIIIAYALIEANGGSCINYRALYSTCLTSSVLQFESTQSDNDES